MEPGFLRNLVDAARQDSRAGAVCGKLLSIGEDFLPLPERPGEVGRGGLDLLWRRLGQRRGERRDLGLAGPGRADRAGRPDQVCEQHVGHCGGSRRHTLGA